MTGNNNWAEMLFRRDKESWDGISGRDLYCFLKPKCQQILTDDYLLEMLDREQPLRIKYGIDPTGSEVHIGHMVPVMLLRQFEKSGHNVQFIIGDFTAQIGDPSGRESSRVALTSEQIQANMKTYRDQIGRFIQLDRVEVFYNSSWLNALSLNDVFDVFGGINMSEAMQRDDFRARAKNAQGVSLAEVCYGVLMGLDSIQLKSDVEVGGIDQLLNFQQCRKVMRQRGLAEEAVLMTSLIEGTAGDGRKMSKSLGNYIAAQAPADDMFGKIMSIPDRLLQSYFMAYGHVRIDEVEAIQQFVQHEPMEAKKQLGALIVAIAHNSWETGCAERENFERKFSERTLTEEDFICVHAQSGDKILEALFAAGHYSSKGELRRMFTQNGVRLLLNDGSEKTLSMDDVVCGECKVRVGKRALYKIIHAA